MSTDFRALCAELTDELSGYASANPHHDSDALVIRARAALAEPGPEDDVALPREALLATAAQCRAEDDARIALAADGPAVPESREPASVTGRPSDEELALIYHDCCRGCEFMDQVNFENAARALLARWGHQPAPVAGEEVGELVAWLRERATWCAVDDPSHEKYDRAADLLAQRHPEPVPMAERLPELRGMFERILCVARSRGQRPVGNIELADRLIKAVVSWSAPLLPAGEVGHG